MSVEKMPLRGDMSGFAAAWRKLFGFGGPVVDRIAVALVCLLLLVSIFGPWLTPHDPYTINPLAGLEPPGAAYWLGTDDVGRDVFSRLLAGAPLTILAAASVVVLATVIGVFVASIAALSPRWLDDIIMRITEIFLSIPSLVLALGLTAVLGSSLTSIIIAMVAALWPGTARVTRNILRETMTSAYVEAAQVMGVSRMRLMLRHALPNSMDAVYVLASMEVSGCIVMMAGLSFLGVGAPPPSADWGSMIAQGQEFITTAWWISLFPGLAITIAAVAFGLVGDAIRRLNDPTLRASR
ncbi:MAG: ABC transporter permease [Rhizobiaceae bacterium]|nr:ABC transporter permease [Rhizobiaceae bacterium]